MQAGSLIISDKERSLFIYCNKYISGDTGLGEKIGRRKFWGRLIRAGVLAELAAIVCLCGRQFLTGKGKEESPAAKQVNSEDGIWEILEMHQKGEILETESGDYIKWVDFTVPASAMEKAYQYDVDSYGGEIHINWIELLAYAAAKQGGDFKKAAMRDIDDCAEALLNGEKIEDLTEKLKYYPYYLEAYSAVLGGFVGEYEADGETRYGLKAFSPIAAGFYYTDYDDETDKIGLIRKALTAKER